MKRYQLVLGCVLYVACQTSSAGAQAFQNLDFETVIFSEEPTPPAPYDAKASLPGWTFSEPADNQLYLNPHLGGQPQQFLITDNFGYGDSPPWPHIQPVQGHYTIFLQEATYATPTGPWVSQTGVIPADAESVRFYGGGGYLGGAESLWFVSINDVPVPVKRFVIGTWLNLPGELPIYSPIIAADVSAFAGAVATIKFTLDREHDHPGWMTLTGGVLDDVRFSTLEYTILPEPTSAVLAIVCFGFIAASHRKRTTKAAISRGLGRAG
jgi:hypothetical protein